MSVISKQYVVLLLIAGLVMVSFAHAAEVREQPQTEKESKEAGVIIVDLVLARPLGILATVTGGAIFLVSLPFSAMTGQTRMVYEKMVKEPARYTFKRPIGDL